MKLVLLGYMGCGKTTIGEQLAATLQYSFVDLDAAIAEDEKMSISRLFETKGEIYFRKKENKMLSHLLSTHKDAVISLGGGTPCYGNVMQLLNENDTILPIYLSATLHTLTERLFHEIEARPMISHISDKEILNDFIRKHIFERSFYYNQAKTKIVTDLKTVQEIVEEIVALLF